MKNRSRFDKGLQKLKENISHTNANLHRLDKVISIEDVGIFSDDKIFYKENKLASQSILNKENVEEYGNSLGETDDFKFRVKLFHYRIKSEMDALTRVSKIIKGINNEEDFSFCGSEIADVLREVENSYLDNLIELSILIQDCKKRILFLRKTSRNNFDELKIKKLAKKISRMDSEYSEISKRSAEDLFNIGDCNLNDIGDLSNYPSLLGVGLDDVDFSTDGKMIVRKKNDPSSTD
jgi:hypothetical protein